MNTHIEMGSAPGDEPCAQVGQDNYSEQARRECRAYIHQLTRIIVAAGKEMPESFRRVIKSNAHDYGTYYEVACKFNDNNEAACELAYWLDENCPGEWDDEARKELAS